MSIGDLFIKLAQEQTSTDLKSKRRELSMVFFVGARRRTKLETSVYCKTERTSRGIYIVSEFNFGLFFKLLRKIIVGQEFQSRQISLRGTSTPLVLRCG